MAIIKGRDADATEADRAKCDEKLKQLKTLVQKFVIRRTNDLLTKYRKFFLLFSNTLKYSNVKNSSGKI